MTAHSCGDGGSMGYRDPGCVACQQTAPTAGSTPRRDDVEAAVDYGLVKPVSRPFGTSHYKHRAEQAERDLGEALALLRLLDNAYGPFKGFRHRIAGLLARHPQEAPDDR